MRLGSIVSSMLCGGLLWGTTGCMIVSYGPEVREPAASSTKEGIARFFFYTGVTRDPSAKENPLPAEAKLIQETLETKAGFAAAVVSAPPVPKGIHLSIDETATETSPASKLFCTLSLVTFTVLPCYSDTGGYLVQYDVMTDSEMKKTYRYEINKTVVQWIALLPLVWVNGLTESYDQAFQGTVYRFLRDSQADGYLPSR